jgi:hypothetical protein
MKHRTRTIKPQSGKIKHRTGIILHAIAAVIILASLSSCGGGASVDTKMTRSVSASDFADYDAVILLDRKLHEVSLVSDLAKASTTSGVSYYSINYRTYRERTVVFKILTEEGMERFGNFSSSTFNKKYHKYELDASVTSPSGKKQSAGSGNIKKMDIGDKYYRYRMTLPALEVGSVVEIRERVKSNVPVLSGYWDFGARVPTLQSELVFKVPKGAVVKFSMTPKANKAWPKPVNEDKFDVYTISKKNIPPYVKEANMPPNYIGNPSLYYCIWQITGANISNFVELNVNAEPYYATWHRIGDQFAYFFDPASWKGAENSAEYRSAIRSFLAELPSSGKTEFESYLGQVLKSFHRKYQAVEDFLFYDSENPEESLLLGEGGPFELAYILRLILREAGIPSSVVIVKDINRGLFDKNIPDIQQLNHPLLLIEGRERDYWIDPYSPESDVNRLPWKCQGVHGLVIGRPGTYAFKATPMDAAVRNTIDSRIDAGFDETGTLSGISRVTVTGQHLMNLKREAGVGKFDEDNKALDTLIDELFPRTYVREDLSIEKDTKDSLCVTVGFSIDDYAERSTNLMSFDFSEWCDRSFHSIFESENRHYDIIFPFCTSVNTTMRIRIPRQFNVAEQAPAVDSRNGSFVYNRMSYQDGESLVLRRYFAVSAATVSAEDFREAKEFADMVYKCDNDPVVLKKNS